MTHWLTKEQARVSGASSSLLHRYLSFLQPSHCWLNFGGFCVVQVDLIIPCEEGLRVEMLPMAMTRLESMKAT